jgi:hypothetical protein
VIASPCCREASKPELDRCEIFGDAVIDTSDWTSFPPDYDPKLHWLVDQCVTQAQLGKGVSWITFQRKHTRKRGRTVQEPPPLENKDSAPLALTQEAPVAAEPAEAPMEQPPKKRSLLGRHSSDEVDVQSAMEIIAEGAKTQFALNVLVCEDQNAKSALYYLQAFTRYAQQNWTDRDHSNTLFYQAFPKVVCGCLLEQSISQSVLQKFTDEFKVLKGIEGLLPKPGIVDVLIDVAQHDKVSWNQLDVASGLTPNKVLV